MQETYASQEEREVTAFQKRVFNIVKKIPRGRVVSYGYIAKLLKTSPRAVGRALHANPFPVKIPCHRVIMADGSAGGYSRGMRRKIALLKKEGVRIVKKRIISL